MTANTVSVPVDLPSAATGLLPHLPSPTVVTMDIPEKFAAYASARWGEPARRWLTSLPATVESLQFDWQLGALTPVPDANRSFVAATTSRDGRRAYLKVEFDPDWDAATQTLRSWSKIGVAPAVLGRCPLRQAALIADAGDPVETDPLRLCVRTC